MTINHSFCYGQISAVMAAEEKHEPLHSLKLNQPNKTAEK